VSQSFRPGFRLSRVRYIRSGCGLQMGGRCETRRGPSRTTWRGVPQWAKSLGPIAAHVAHVFGKAMDSTYSAATPRTSRRHRDAQAVVKARKVEASRRAAAGRVLQRPPDQSAALPLWTCVAEPLDRLDVVRRIRNGGGHAEAEPDALLAYRSLGRP